MRDDDSGHAVLVSQVIIKLLKISLSVAFFSDLFCFIVKVQRGRASLQFSEELLPKSQHNILEFSWNMATFGGAGSLIVACGGGSGWPTSGICGSSFGSSSVHSNQL